MNVAVGAATQWLFNFVIARSKFLPGSISRDIVFTDPFVAVLTMQETMGTGGYVRYFSSLILRSTVPPQ